MTSVAQIRRRYDTQYVLTVHVYLYVLNVHVCVWHSVYLEVIYSAVIWKNNLTKQRETGREKINTYLSCFVCNEIQAAKFSFFLASLIYIHLRSSEPQVRRVALSWATFWRPLPLFSCFEYNQKGNTVWRRELEENWLPCLARRNKQLSMAKATAFRKRA